jgi:hypothetical protein
MYAEFATDPKVQILSEVEQRRYLMLLCMRCCNGDVTLQDEIVAFQLRICNDEWQKTKSILLHKNLIDDANKPVAWNKRQYQSDSSKSRVSKHRENKKRRCNVTVTGKKRTVETETETEKEIKEESLTTTHLLTEVVETDSASEVETEKAVSSSKISINEFRFLFQQATGEFLPGGLNNEASQICKRYPRDQLEDAFSITAGQGGKTLKYFKAVLKGEPRRAPPSTKTFDQIRLENIKNAMMGAINDEAGLAGIQFAAGRDSPGVQIGHQPGNNQGLRETPG